MWGESGIYRAETSESVCNEEDIARIKSYHSQGLCMQISLQVECLHCELAGSFLQR